MYIQGLHGIYTFDNKKGERIHWYAQADMIAFNHKLYHVIRHRANMMECYTWLAKQATTSNHILVMNTDFEIIINEYGHLGVQGSRFDRYSGKIDVLGIGGFAHCIQCVPVTPWWLDPQYNKKINTIYANKDRVMPKLVKLQSALKKWAYINSCQRRNERVNQYCHGWLRLLPDDVLELIVQMVIRVTSTPRCVELKLVLPETLPESSFSTHCEHLDHE